MTAAFLGLEAALYAAFMTLDLTGGSGDPGKYASIAVCLVFSVLFARRGGSRLMAAAMALTLGADTFLLLLNRWYGAGLALFCGVQGLYLIRILRRCGRSLWGLRLFLVTAAFLGLWALGLLSPLNLLAAVYFANFLVNACQALSLSMPLFAWGLWLFLLCDVCVGVHNQPELFPEWLAAFAQVGMWLFLLDLRVLAVCVAVLLVLYALRRKKGLTLCPLAGHSPGFWAGCGLGGALAIAGVLAALDFDRAFTVFHSIFFPGKDNWLFDPATDPVILILPEAFFRSCAILILAAVLLCCAALIIADLCRRRRAP